MFEVKILTSRRTKIYSYKLLDSKLFNNKNDAIDFYISYFDSVCNTTIRGYKKELSCEYDFIYNIEELKNTRRYEVFKNDSNDVITVILFEDECVTEDECVLQIDTYVIDSTRGKSINKITKYSKFKIVDSKLTDYRNFLINEIMNFKTNVKREIEKEYKTLLRICSDTIGVSLPLYGGIRYKNDDNRIELLFSFQVISKKEYVENFI